MGATHFSGPVYSGGMPLYTGVPYPFTGNYFFVNPTTGNDGNTGAADSPLQTLAAAHALCTANNNDVVFLVSDGSARLSSTLVWSKNRTHLIGIGAPTEVAQRARISMAVGSTVFTPFVSVTAEGCYFNNFSLFYGYANASAQIGWAETGGRNFYSSVDFGAPGDATAAAQTGMRVITIGAAGTGENTFYNCTFGLDTITRNATNYTLEFKGGSPRNTFRSCQFLAYLGASGAAATHIYTAGTATIDRWQLFDQCVFHNAVNSGGTTMNQVANLAASSGGYLLMKSCSSVGATHYETTPTNQMFVDGGPPTSNTTGLAIHNT